MSNCVFILSLFVTSPSRLLCIVSIYFLALFFFNICQHGCQILYFELRVDGRKFNYRRTAAVCAPLPETSRGRVHLLMPGYKGLSKTLCLKAARITPTLPGWGKHSPRLQSCSPCHTLFHGANTK